LHIAFDEYRNPLCSIKFTTARPLEYRVRRVKSPNSKKGIRVREIILLQKSMAEEQVDEEEKY